MLGERKVAVALRDRGTVDGLVYWPDPPHLWPAMGTTSEREQARYRSVIHIRVPTADRGYHTDPIRIETAV